MRKYSFLLVLVLALASVSNASAHTADMYFHTHVITLSSDGIHIIWKMLPGPLLAQNIWDDADKNQDELVSDEEAQIWSQVISQSCSAQLNGVMMALDFETVEWPSSVAEIYGGEPIGIHYKALWPSGLGQTNQLTIHNYFHPKESASWFNVRGESGVSFDIPTQTQRSLSLNFYISTTGEKTGNVVAWESGRPSLPPGVEALGLENIAGDIASQSSGSSAITAILGNLLKKQDTSPFFPLATLGIAALLGVLHALSPGHGKTIVAAYLVGSQGKFYHAIALGILVTLTHTGSVLILGLLTLTVSRSLQTAQILPLLELLSGLLILLLGVGLLHSRLRDWLANRRRQQAYPSPVVVDEIDGDKKRLVLNQPIMESGPPHSHTPSESGYIPRKTTPGFPLQGIRWRSLAALGFSGGLVPCPDAIAILLIAATINRIGWGMSMIVAFSAGLAMVLIAIGIMILQGKRLFERMRWFDKIAYIVPVLSALVVLMIGGFLTGSAIAKIDNLSLPGSGSKAIGKISPFALQKAHVIYKAPDTANQEQLFIVPASGGLAEQITAESQGIWDYALSPDRTSIVYTTCDDAKTFQLWVLSPDTREKTHALTCSEAICSTPVWHPDGKSILYNRAETNTDTNPFGFMSIWWLDLTTYETAPLFQHANLPGFTPRWSPDGTWLSYLSINPQGLHLYQITTGIHRTLPTQTGSPSVWSPDGNALLLVDMKQMGNLFLSKLFRYDLASDQLTQLSDAQNLDEKNPTWSPDGAWIAVIRHEWQVKTSVFGSQIWLMRPDGSDAHPITQGQKAIYNHAIWSPDSRYILYDLVRIDEDQGQAGIHILNIESGEMHRIAISGSHPDWLP